ncbi:phosphodiester glycosidase family protein [Lachnospiraceae bacterium 54-53]
MKKKKFIVLLMVDFFIALLSVGAFLLYFYVLPRRENSAGINIIGEESADSQTFDLPETQESTGSGKSRPSRKNGDRSAAGNGNTNTKEIASDKNELALSGKTDTVLEEYKDSSLQLTIIKSELGEGDDKITYYTADVYVSAIGQLQTAFAEGVFGKNLRESTLEMAEDNQALLAVSGDSYGNNETGIVVRNGVLYRSDTNDGEICVLFQDGVMKTYTPEEFEQEQVLESEVWQAWNFGPSLLDNGSVKTTFQTTSYLNNSNPRCAIGYISPGHYKLVLVDGRNPGYSKGATMSELAGIMAAEGCTLAYNLDGGKSSAMVYQGNYVNQPADGGRSISDIIYIRKEES